MKHHDTRHAISVLNALRHQWYFHIEIGSGVNNRTTVLNALRHQWYFHVPLRTSDLILTTCAQRLTASMVFSRRPLKPLLSKGS